MKYLMAGEICKLLSIPHRTLHEWVRGGIVRPMVTGAGTGCHHVFGVIDTLAIAAGRSLRAGGIGLAPAGSAMRYVMTMTEETLTHDLAAGRTMLVLIGPIAVERLLSRDEMMSSRPLAAAQADGAPIVAIDLGRLYRNLLAAVEKMSERPELAPAAV